MKKFLSVVLALMMVLSLCTACGKAGGNGDVTLTWYVPGDKQADTALINEALSAITMEKIGCKVNIEFIDDGSFQERMNMNMASGSNYDLAFVGYLNQFDAAASKGGLLELDELLKKAPKIQETIPEYILNSGLYDGKMYAIPNMQITANATAITFNKALVDKYGFDVSKVERTQDAETFMETLKKNEPKVYPFKSGWGIQSFRSLHEGEATEIPMYQYPYRGEVLWTAVADSENETFTARFLYDEDVSRTKDKAATLHDYYTKGYIRSDVDSVLDDSSELKKGMYGIWFGTYKPGMDGEMLGKYGFETISTRISPVTLGSASATMIGIGKNCKHPEEAIKFIELINTDVEAYNIVCFGIEGKHYTKTGEDSIELIEGSKYNPSASWKFGNQFNAYRLPGQPETVWEETRELNDLGYQYNLENPTLETFGFKFNTEEILPTVTKVKEVQTKYNFIKHGVKDPDTYWDAMIDELYAAGLQNILDEYQDQIDTFMEANPDVADQINW